jgi:hypothetical protein
VYLAPVRMPMCQREDLEGYLRKREPTLRDLHVYSWLVAVLMGVFLVSGAAVVKGKARVLVTGFLVLTSIVGVVLLVFGTVGFVQSRDWRVAGPSLLLGGIQVVAPAIIFLMSRTYYRKAAHS